MAADEVQTLCGSPTMKDTLQSGRVKHSYLRGPMDSRSDALHITFDNGQVIDYSYFDPATGQKATLIPAP